MGKIKVTDREGKFTKVSFSKVNSTAWGLQAYFRVEKREC